MDEKKRDGSQNKEHGKTLQQVKKSRKKDRRKNRFFAAEAVVIIAIVALWIFFTKLLVIRSFEIRGNYEHTEQEAILAAHSIGLSEGDNLFGFDRSSTELAAKYNLPEYDSVKIRYSLPGKIVFEVTEAVPVMFTTLGDEAYLLSKGLRVTSRETDMSKVEALALKKVYMSGIEKCVAGDFLETSNGTDEILKDLYAVLEEEGIAPEVSEINVQNKFNIEFLYKQRFTVRLGNAENFTVKIRFMKSISEKLYETANGYIDVSDDDLREGYYKPYQ